jgi:hypothetical protein
LAQELFQVGEARFQGLDLRVPLLEAGVELLYGIDQDVGQGI